MGNKVKKLFNFLLLGSLLMSLVGCSVTKEKNGDEKQASTEAPIYERSTSPFKISEDANPYMIDYGEKSFYYFVMGRKKRKKIRMALENRRLCTNFFIKLMTAKMQFLFAK